MVLVRQTKTPGINSNLETQRYFVWCSGRSLSFVRPQYNIHHQTWAISGYNPNICYNTLNEIFFYHFNYTFQFFVCRRSSTRPGMTIELAPRPRSESQMAFFSRQTSQCTLNPNDGPPMSPWQISELHSKHNDGDYWLDELCIFLCYWSMNG